MKSQYRPPHPCFDWLTLSLMYRNEAEDSRIDFPDSLLDKHCTILVPSQMKNFDNSDKSLAAHSSQFHHVHIYHSNHRTSPLDLEGP